MLWGNILAVASAALSLGSGITHWVSRRRQALRERSFGNILRDEIQRHLSLVHYALSRHGRAQRLFLTIAPLFVLAAMFTRLSVIVNGLPINPIRIQAIVIPAFFLCGDLAKSLGREVAVGAAASAHGAAPGARCRRRAERELTLRSARPPSQRRVFDPPSDLGLTLSNAQI